MPKSDDEKGALAACNVNKDGSMPKVKINNKNIPKANPGKGTQAPPITSKHDTMPQSGDEKGTRSTEDEKIKTYSIESSLNKARERTDREIRRLEAMLKQRVDQLRERDEKIEELKELIENLSLGNSGHLPH